MEEDLYILQRLTKAEEGSKSNFGHFPDLSDIKDGTSLSLNTAERKGTLLGDSQSIQNECGGGESLYSGGSSLCQLGLAFNPVKMVQVPKRDLQIPALNLKGLLQVQEKELFKQNVVGCHDSASQSSPSLASKSQGL